MPEREKIQLEYLLKCSPKVLFSRLNSASGLSEWFAENVKVKGNTYSFFWDGSEHVAEKLFDREGKQVRYRWLDMPEECYFEFKVVQDELTNDVSLNIIDFVEPDEMDESIELWNRQIVGLKRVIGS
ncbi:MAG: START-like domain-containing protein [Bacteroidota bacterium]|nr:START-like domain-containing protein [Bacteroidota bacterium]MDP4205653.1 START-like domain-containing protein [Bacteroidota bacterium]